MVHARDYRRQRMQTPSFRSCFLARAKKVKGMNDGIVYGADMPTRHVPESIRFEIVIESVGNSRPILLADRQAHEACFPGQMDIYGTGPWNARQYACRAKLYPLSKPATLYETALPAHACIRATVVGEHMLSGHIRPNARAEGMGYGSG